MTKDELKRLSETTFFDNEQGGITPVGHRNFNTKLIENMMTVSDLGIDGVNSHILPSVSSTYSLGSNNKTWNAVYTNAVGTGSSNTQIRLNSDFIPSSNQLINLGVESNKFMDICVHKINGTNFSNTGWTVCNIEGSTSTSLYWSVSGNSLFLSGEYKPASGSTSSIHITNIPEVYLKRVQTGNYCLDIRNSSQKIIRIAGSISISGSKLTITSLDSANPFNTANTLILSASVFPLPENKNEVIRQISGVDYTDWVYDETSATKPRSRTAKPWTQDVYADVRLGEKKYGQAYTDTEEPVKRITPGTSWEYEIAANKLTATRTKKDKVEYIYPDITKVYYEINATETANIGTHLSSNKYVLGYSFAGYLLPAVNNYVITNNTAGCNYIKTGLYKNTFFVLCKTGKMLVSKDGFIWKTQTIAANIECIDFTYSAYLNKICVLSKSGTKYGLYSIDIDNLITGNTNNWTYTLVTDSISTGLTPCCISDEFTINDRTSNNYHMIIGCNQSDYYTFLVTTSASDFTTGAYTVGWNVAKTTYDPSTGAAIKGGPVYDIKYIRSNDTTLHNGYVVFASSQSTLMACIYTTLNSAANVGKILQTDTTTAGKQASTKCLIKTDNTTVLYGTENGLYGKVNSTK